MSELRGRHALLAELAAARAEERRWAGRVDALILDAHNDGASLREIAEIVGVTNVTIFNWLRRPRAGRVRAGA